jgi:hypothetical protein
VADNEKQYFCVEDPLTTEFYCLDDSNSRNECNLGKLIVISTESQNASLASIKLLNLTDTIPNGKYAINFYSFFGGKNDGNNSISIKLNRESDSDITELLYLSRSNDYQWKQESTYFIAQNSSHDVRRAYLKSIRLKSLN